MLTSISLCLLYEVCAVEVRSTFSEVPVRTIANRIGRPKNSDTRLIESSRQMKWPAIDADNGYRAAGSVDQSSDARQMRIRSINL
jgi:hypothetical protein